MNTLIFILSYCLNKLWHYFTNAIKAVYLLTELKGGRIDQRSEEIGEAYIFLIDNYTSISRENIVFIEDAIFEKLIIDTPIGKALWGLIKWTFNYIKNWIKIRRKKR